MAAMFVIGSKQNEQFPQRTFHRCFLPRFGPFGQAVSEQKISRNRPIRNKNGLCWPCLLMDRDKMSNFLQRTFHRCFLPTFGSFGKVVSEEKIFRNQPIRNKKCLWRPYLLMDRDEMSNLDRRPPIDASYQISVHLTKRFQRRFFQKSTNQKQELSVAAIFVNGSGQNQQSLQKTFHRCFLPGFGSFGQTVSEEKNLKYQPMRNKNRLWRPCFKRIETE